MPRWQRVYVVATCAVIGWCLAYALCDWGGWARLTTDPYRGGWWWASGPTQKVPINYYGIILWGVLGGAVGTIAGGVVGKLGRRPLGDGAVALLAAWALTAFLFAGGFYTWNLWPF